MDPLLIVILVGVGLAVLLGMLNVRGRRRGREEIEERVQRESFFSNRMRM